MPSINKIIDAQVSSWVTSLCDSHGISDPEILAASKKKVKYYILSRMEEDNIGVDGLTGLLAEALKTLNRQLDSNASTGQ
jgi:hypothetical protein